MSVPKFKCSSGDPSSYTEFRHRANIRTALLNWLSGQRYINGYHPLVGALRHFVLQEPRAWPLSLHQHYLGYPQRKENHYKTVSSISNSQSPSKSMVLSMKPNITDKTRMMPRTIGPPQVMNKHNQHCLSAVSHLEPWLKQLQVSLFIPGCLKLKTWYLLRWGGWVLDESCLQSGSRLIPS